MALGWVGLAAPAFAQAQAAVASRLPVSVAIFVSSLRDRCIDPGDVAAIRRLATAEQDRINASGGILRRPLQLQILDDAGLREVTIGTGGVFHAVVPAETWQAARPRGDGYSLVGCTVAPPFTFERFELADRTLLDRWPEHRERIAGRLRR